MDIGAWLRGLELGQYEAAFRDNAVDLDVLPDLGEADLERLGVLLAHRKRLLRAIAALREPAAPPAPPPQLTVMFADLVGSTALAAWLDPEEMREIIRLHDPERDRGLASGLFDGAVRESGAHRHFNTNTESFGGCIAAFTNSLLRRPETVLRRAYALRSSATDHAVPYWAAAADILHGWAALLGDTDDAEAALRKALHLARDQEARDLLAPIYGWLTEGFRYTGPPEGPCAARRAARPHGTRLTPER